jgi:predicted NBD/HSP70 family sugar kinase
VVELRPDPSIVVGDVPWGLGAALAAHDPTVTVLPYPITDPSPDGTADAAALAGRAAGRPLVLVVRDLHRHGRQRDLVERLLLARPDAVVVEMGVPVLAPERAAGYLRTHGAGRVNAEAAADLLLGREPAAAKAGPPPAGAGPGGAAAAGRTLPTRGKEDGSMSGEALRLLGVDIGGTKIAVAVVEAADGTVLVRRVEPTPAAQGPLVVVEAAADLAARVLAAYPATAAGVGAPGVVDAGRGVVVTSTGVLPGWEGTAVAAELERRLGLPFAADNDVNAAALGEARYGAGRGLGSFLLVVVGTGLGGAIVRDGRCAAPPAPPGNSATCRSPARTRCAAAAAASATWRHWWPRPASAPPTSAPPARPASTCACWRDGPPTARPQPRPSCTGSAPSSGAPSAGWSTRSTRRRWSLAAGSCRSARRSGPRWRRRCVARC